MKYNKGNYMSRAIIIVLNFSQSKFLDTTGVITLRVKSLQSVCERYILHVLPLRLSISRKMLVPVFHAPQAQYYIRFITIGKENPYKREIVYHVIVKRHEIIFNESAI